MIFEVILKAKLDFQIFNPAAITAEGPTLQASRELLGIFFFIRAIWRKKFGIFNYKVLFFYWSYEHAKYMKKYLFFMKIPKMLLN